MLRLTRRSVSAVPLEAPCIVPDRLAGLTLAQIERLPIQHGNRVEELAEHFTVGGDPSALNVAVDGDCSRVKWLGAGMKDGHLRIESAVGMHAGSGMHGGRIDIMGPADDWLGAEMHGGQIRVRGSAGNHAGAAYEGSVRGMTGGILLVDGLTGTGTGAVMRRGLIATTGCGDFACASMVAGSLFVFGALGRYAGAEMKRGSIVTSGPEPKLLPTFRLSCDYEPAFLPIYLRRLAELGFEPARDVAVKSVRRYCGDLVSRGLGEILHVSS